ncbi:MAG: LysM peptidoglycan-binding domain-containing protein [Aeromicrobium sp.]
MWLTRSGWALAALATAIVLLLLPETASLARDARGDDFPRAARALVALLLLALAVWIMLIVGLGAAIGSPGLVRAVTPRLARRALFVGAAGALAVSPVHADRGVAPVEHTVDGLPLPDRPTTGSTAGELVPSRPAPTAPAVMRHSPALRYPARPVVVRDGDTLWAIAERSLPPGSSTTDIARATARWHAANRAVIGDDPDLIFPHQRLTPPGKDQP